MIAGGLKLPSLASFIMIVRENGLKWPGTSENVVIQAGLFKTLLRLALELVPVDEKYYLRTYPDVADALAKGLFTSPRHHFVEFGYFENRRPFRIIVDEDFYLRSNPDVAAGVNDGLIRSIQLHFENYGYKEGRLPSDGWSLIGA